ncbi:MAG: undecaprenyldiphospho-muramoylpentapeptide beta-N-acetylglucosaminyltransferase [Patescibacteria group bacterium]|jgi:UDP-N-acetylglucosamine--N-acetylmuramyl-(pentapeptide) pyrophosphoryl-undecaprenol N-acetylglucosamine transferase|nr:undecaprenyldiphospho-muramoylpentapeptide beta-N-acetylglucosaminyltransferase [Patescibacteria group bacterium]
MPPKTILFAGGGTGGHIVPLLAVMEAVQEASSDTRCVYVGLPGDLKSPLIKESPLRFEKESIVAGKIHRYLTLDQFRQAVHMVKGFSQAYRLVKKIRPQVIFCKGGSVTVPIAVAARLRGIPVFCHETDVVTGLSNRLIAKISKTVFVSFPGSEEKTVYVGQPVRPEFAMNPAQKKLVIEGEAVSEGLPLVIVIGGSQGARAVNNLVAKSWNELLRKVTLLHICGEGDFASLKKDKKRLAPELQKRLHLHSFVKDELPLAFVKASLVISRAGGTIHELAAASKASILIPLPSAAQNHQWANAKLLEKEHAAAVLDEKTATPAILISLVTELLENPIEKRTLEVSISRFYKPDAASVMAQALLAT